MIVEHINSEELLAAGYMGWSFLLFRKICICLFDKQSNMYGKRKNHKKRDLLSTSLLPTSGHIAGILKAGVCNFIWVFHIICRGPATWAVNYCFPRHILRRSFRSRATRTRTGILITVDASIASHKADHWVLLLLFIHRFYTLCRILKGRWNFKEFFRSW